MEVTFALDKKNSTPGKEVYNLRGPVDLLIEGETVNVTTKSGKLQPRTVGRVFWRGTDNNGNAIALAEQAGGGKAKAVAQPAISELVSQVNAMERFLIAKFGYLPDMFTERKAPSESDDDHLPF